MFPGHLADFTNGSALGDAAVFDELDLGLEARGEDDVRLARDGIFLGKAAGDGGTGDGIDEGAVEEFGIAEENADGEAERAVGRHKGGMVGVWLGSEICKTDYKSTLSIYAYRPWVAKENLVTTASHCLKYGVRE